MYQPVHLYRFRFSLDAETVQVGFIRTDCCAAIKVSFKFFSSCWIPELLNHLLFPGFANLILELDHWVLQSCLGERLQGRVFPEEKLFIFVSAHEVVQLLLSYNLKDHPPVNRVGSLAYLIIFICEGLVQQLIQFERHRLFLIVFFLFVLSKRVVLIFHWKQELHR